MTLAINVILGLSPQLQALIDQVKAEEIRSVPSKGNCTYYRLEITAIQAYVFMTCHPRNGAQPRDVDEADCC